MENICARKDEKQFSKSNTSLLELQKEKTKEMEEEVDKYKEKLPLKANYDIKKG